AKCQLKAVFLNIISATILLINLSFAIFSIIPGYTVYFDFLESFPKIGPAFLFYGILTIIPFAIAALIIIIRWRYLQRLVHPEIMFLVNFLPVLGVIGQALSVDFTITITSLILTFIISALGLQHHFVVTDYLTGLYNRRRLIQKLNEKINKTRKNGFFAGYMIDLNDFKKLNDEQGHKAGDAVLREFAEILMSISDNSDLVSRFGGDEFVVIRTLKSPDELKDYKHKLIEAINTYNALPTTNQTVTLSIGCRIFYKDQDSTAEQFLNIIDKAMYENKKQRKLIEQAVGCEVEN
ncbi:MAG: GGDEF domain-containing protein, partial [Alphaproteobacteria bacterium]